MRLCDLWTDDKAFIFRELFFQIWRSIRRERKRRTRVHDVPSESVYAELHETQKAHRARIARCADHASHPETCAHARAGQCHSARGRARTSVEQFRKERRPMQHFLAGGGYFLTFQFSSLSLANQGVPIEKGKTFSLQGLHLKNFSRIKNLPKSPLAPHDH